MNTTVFVEDFKKTTTKIRLNIPTVYKKNATVELLKSSVLIAVSGALRVYIACLLLQTQPSIITCIAGGLIIYSVYTLDRSLDSEEDVINRKELSGSKKEIGIAASVITFLIGSYVLAKEGMLAVAFLPLIIGYLYSKGIKIGKFTFRLKGGLGIKNVVVGITWGIFIAWLACNTCKSVISIVLVFILYGIKTGINSVIDDFKDVNGDALTGLKTLPVTLGERNTHRLLTSLHIITHLILGIALILKLIAYEPLVLLSSFICGLICIQRYTKEDYTSIQKVGSTFFKDGESTITIILRGIAGTFFV
ncbi:MAG: UbiA family prenyltransferase [Parabacteroides sp.]|nr:UbiA family prenyltransferase [Parabacteroides sp.]